MNARRRAGFVFPAIAIVIGTAGMASAQGTLRRQTPETSTTDSSGNVRIAGPGSQNEKVARGQVVLADGSAPEELVELYGGCGGARRFIAVSDSKGRFTFSLKALDDRATATGCVLYASLEGYRSETAQVPDLSPKSDEKLGRITLQPISLAAAGVSSTAGDVGKSQRKMFEKAIDEAARQEWAKAIASLQNLTSASPGYSSAWLSLGILQQSGGQRAAAEKSFLEAVRTDPKFALPLIRAAALEAVQGDWQATLDHSQKAIELNSAAFPNAYALNALANLSLQHADAAEKSAREGLRLDTTHQYPELEYALGIVLYGKNDVTGATKHLQAYVDQSPNGPNAAAARKQLANATTVDVALSASPASRVAQLDKSAKDATNSSLMEHNAPLLIKTPSHTCLESISRAQVDNHGRLHGTEAMRVEIAISDGKEIYAQADGKRFSNEGLAGLTGYTFSTTGLFSSIARALIAGNDVSIEPAGEESLNGEAVLRYNFHSLPGAAGWSIQYGIESGRAGEEGWFLVDQASMVLRRVVVHAVDVPRNLKLKTLQAVIDYQPETIADRLVLLPDVAQVNVEERAGTQRVSRIFFDHCRAFGAESAISFEGDDTSAQSNQRAGKLEVPPGLDVAVSLLSPLSAQSAAASDVVTASVAQPVMSNGRELIARGARVEGHVRLRRGENAVVIELDRVQTQNGWAPFYARLLSLASSGQARAEGEGRESGGDATLADPEIPGVAKLHFIAKSGELPAGTRMVWKTEALMGPAEAHAPQLNTTINMR